MKQSELFDNEEAKNGIRVNVLRFVGFLLMMFGIYLLFSPLLTTISWIPLVGYFMKHALSMVVWIFAFLVAGVFSLLTIAIAWLYYRPVLAILLISGIAGTVYLIMFLSTPPK